VKFDFYFMTGAAIGGEYVKAPSGQAVLVLYLAILTLMVSFGQGKDLEDEA
jgi:hypothetical protein